MGFGILEPRDGHHAPGTTTLDQSAAGAIASKNDLKHGSGKDCHIVLVPQPSNDPNDPLNWSSTKKNIVLAIILMGTAFVCIIPSPMLNAGIVQIATDLDRSFSDIAKLNGYMLLAMGAASPFVSAAARKCGKRPVFVISSILGLIGCLVAEFAGNYNTLVAGRLIQGFGASAYESLCTSVVNDLCFVHQRGTYVALVVFFLSSLSNGVSVLAGVITTRLGWPYNFHILLPFVALQLILVVLFVPETVYNRPTVLNIDRVGSGLDVIGAKEKQSHTDHVEVTASFEPKEEAGCDSETARNIEAVPKPKSFWRQLAIYNGVFTEKSLFSMVLSSIVIMVNLIASYNVLVSGLIMAWFVAMSVLAGVMFSAPPWGFDAAAAGYVSAGPLIGGAIAAVFLVVASDPLIKYMTRRNSGVYEPEFRLLLAVFGGTFSVAGLVGFGHAIEDQMSIYAISTIWGLTLFGMSVVASITTGYALDAQPAHAVEIFTMNITFKNFFFYGLTNFIVEWYVAKGAAQVFDVIGGITAFLILLTIPMLPVAGGSVEVTILDGGGFTTADDTKLHMNGHNQPYYLYDWCFYVHHRPTGRRILWDLGISDDRNLYTPFILNYHWPSCNPVGPRRRLVDQLRDLCVEPKDIDTVIFSHAHWDHCRPIKSDFPNARAIFGPGTGSHCSPGHVRDGQIQPMVQWDSRFFGDGDVRTEDVEELAGPWREWGPFERAFDYFGDGSFWVVQAPGHMAGNLAACARLESGEYVLLASDCCHSRDIFLSIREIANVLMPDGSRFCLHEDLDAALATIDRLREAVREYGMHIAMAHDPEFIQEGTDPVLMSLLHPLFDQACLARIRAHQQP